MTIQNVEVATKAIVINKEKKILILQRSANDSHASGEFDLPGGRLMLGEEPIRGMKRELFEETGINMDNFMPITTWSFNRDITQIVGITYIVKYDSDNSIIKLSNEHQSYKWISESDIIENKTELPIWLKKVLILAFNIYKKFYGI